MPKNLQIPSEHDDHSLLFLHDTASNEQHDGIQ